MARSYPFIVYVRYDGRRDFGFLDKSFVGTLIGTQLDGNGNEWGPLGILERR